MILGCHCGMSGTTMMLGSVKEALSYGANALMIYTGAPQNTIRKQLKELHIEEALKLMDEYQISRKNLVIHAPYIINPATTDLEKREFCVNYLTQEVLRSYAMGSKVIVLHPGNTLGNSLESSIANICSVVNEIIENTKETDVVIAFETMAGKGTEVGRTFEEVKALLDGVINQERVGVCIDTCHMFDSGYDLVNDYENVKKELDSVIGFDRIKVIHVNDSKNKYIEIDIKQSEKLLKQTLENTSHFETHKHNLPDSFNKKLEYHYKKAKENPFMLAFALCIVGYACHNIFCYQQVCCTPFLFIVLGIGESLTKSENFNTIK